MILNILQVSLLIILLSRYFRLCFAVVYISIAIVKYLFNIIASFPLNSSKSMNAYKGHKILLKSYIIVHIIIVYVFIFEFI